MAKTIYESFNKLKSNLEITSLQQSTVSSRQQNVKKAVEKDFSVLRSFLTGSYKRHTMISPLKQADIDICTVLDSDYYYNYNPQSLLDKLKKTLKKTYPKSPKISRNGQAVTISFTDFNVDVVPAFDSASGGYIIPTTNGEWLVTNPEKHVEIFSAANALHNGKLVPLLKMIKCWNKNINYHFRSFSLEVLALNIFNNYDISNYPSAIEYFFNKGREKIKSCISDPAGYSGDIGSYLDNSMSTAVTKFNTAYSRACNADSYQTSGKISNSVNEWRKIFGSDFPAYG